MMKIEGPEGGKPHKSGSTLQQHHTAVIWNISQQRVLKDKVRWHLSKVRENQVS
jgi:hypothetical protein